MARQAESHLLAAWAEKQGITLQFIQPGNPQQNAYVERFNRTVRYDWLNQYLFTTIEEVQMLQQNGSWWDHTYAKTGYITNSRVTDSTLEAPKNGGITMVHLPFLPLIKFHYIPLGV